MAIVLYDTSVHVVNAIQSFFPNRHPLANRLGKTGSTDLGSKNDVLHPASSNLVNRIHSDKKDVIRELLDKEHHDQDSKAFDTGDVSNNDITDNNNNKDRRHLVVALNDGNIQTAVNLWISNQASAITIYGNITEWDTSGVTDMFNLFYNKNTFNDDIGGWDVSSVTRMYQMFYNTPFNQNIGSWDVSSVMNMDAMFSQTSAFNEDIGSWNLSSITTMGWMFQDATAFNQDISSWVMSSDPTDMAYMFFGATAFNQDVNAWDVSSVTYMGSMFNGASSFSQAICWPTFVQGTNIANIVTGTAGATFTTNCTAAPTASPIDPKFDWSIYQDNPFVDIEFDDTNADSELIFHYTAADKTTTVKILDYDNCNVSDTTSDAIVTLANPTRGSTALDIIVDINQTSITTSDFYKDVDSDGDGVDDAATIDFCIRIDLIQDRRLSQSVNFFESKIAIDVDMKEGFQVLNVATNRTEATETEKNATLDYAVQAFECDDTGSQVIGGKQYTQGDFLEICVETNSTAGAKVANIIKMDLIGDTTYSAIAGGSTSSLVARDCTTKPNTDCYTKVMLVSQFFQNANPSPINVTGTCVMEFERARRLSSFRGGRGGDRSLQEAAFATDDGAAEQFGLQVALQGMDMDELTPEQEDVKILESAAASTTTSIAVIASFVVSIFSAFLM